MAHNAACHAKKSFGKCVIFNAEELLVDLYFHFDYSSKRKDLFLEFCTFHVQDSYKILKFYKLSYGWKIAHSVCSEIKKENFKNQGLAWGIHTWHLGEK